MAKTRSQATTTPAPTTSTNNGRVQKSKLRKGRPGRRERQIMREANSLEQQSNSGTKQALLDTNKGDNTSEPSPPPQPTESSQGQKQKKPRKKKGKVRGVVNRVYYNRPDAWERRFGALSAHLSKVLECRVVNAKTSLKEFLKKKEGTFRDYTKQYTQNLAWDEANARQRREKDIDLIKTFIEAYVKKIIDKEKHRLEERHEERLGDMERLADDLYDDIKAEKVDILAMVKEQLDGQKDFEKRLSATQEILEKVMSELKAMKEKMEGMQQVSRDKQRWAIRAPAPLMDNSD